MKRFAATFLLLSLCVFYAAAQVDSARLAQLDARLGEYFTLLEREPSEVKNQECDALIEAAEDPAIRQAIARKVYDHYRNSTLMGDEAVAIHVTDTWFASGKVPMRSESELFEAKMFAEFNRRSLIGEKAPRIVLSGPYGETVTVPFEGYSVLYFYDTDCAKCKLETATLRSLLNDKDYPVTVYAIYVGTNEERWTQWRNSFTLDTEETEVVHLWDPDNTADLQFTYGVVQTPKMFLVDPEGVIAGRGLDSEALEQLLEILLDDGEYDYGSDASAALFDKLFSTYGPKVTAADVADVASLLKGRTLDLGDTLKPLPSLKITSSPVQTSGTMKRIRLWLSEWQRCWTVSCQRLRSVLRFPRWVSRAGISSGNRVGTSFSMPRAARSVKQRWNWPIHWGSNTSLSTWMHLKTSLPARPESCSTPSIFHPFRSSSR